MNIGQMHTWFRQYAQQMGMQNVRAILPEQIDLLINTSIIDTVNQIITQNIGITNDRIISDNSKIGQVNALKTLYTVEEIYCTSSGYSQYSTTDDTEDNPYFDFNDSPDGIALLIEFYDKDENGGEDNTDVKVLFKFNNTGYEHSDFSDYEIIDCRDGLGTDRFNKYFKDNINSISKYGMRNEINAVNLANDEISFSGIGQSYVRMYATPIKAGVKSAEQDLSCSPIQSIFYTSNEKSQEGMISSSCLNLDWLYLVDFSINYKSNAGYGYNEYGKLREYVSPKSPTFYSKYFPVRLIDDAFLADTLNDFILAPKLRSPILNIYNNHFDLYFGKFEKGNDDTYILENGLVPNKFRVSYIAKPAKVKYSEDLGTANVNCNLPEYLHVDILKHAVDLYRASVSGSMLAQQSQDQAQQREIARNNAVPSNGYSNNQQ